MPVSPERQSLVGVLAPDIPCIPPVGPVCPVTDTNDKPLPKSTADATSQYPDSDSEADSTYPVLPLEGEGEVPLEEEGEVSEPGNQHTRTGL